jgi:hypothetical protein
MCQAMAHSPVSFISTGVVRSPGAAEFITQCVMGPRLKIEKPVHLMKNSLQLRHCVLELLCTHVWPWLGHSHPPTPLHKRQGKMTCPNGRNALENKHEMGRKSCHTQY